MEKEIKDINVENYLGIDIEHEDRSVGIFGNVFILVFDDENGCQHQINFGDKEFDLIYKRMTEIAKDKKFYYDWNGGEFENES